MAAHEDELAALEDLIAALSAAMTGDRKLDLRIEYCLGVALAGQVDVANLMIDEGFSWDTVSEAVECRVPAYTGSLDAAVRGENIVFVMKSTRRGEWGAVHRDDAGREFLVWAATEAIARRLAALTGWRAQLIAAAGKPQPVRERTAGVTPAPFAAVPPDGEESDWKVLF